MRARVVVAGSILVGAQVEITALAGSTLEFVAVPLSRKVDGPAVGATVGALDGGASTVVLSDVGDDADGRACVDRLAWLGADTSHISVHPGEATGARLTCYRDEGEPLHIAVPAGVNTASAADLALPTGCQAGDALVVDAQSVPKARRLLDEAFHADLQVIADLRPFPRFGVAVGGRPALEVADLARIDVIVVDLEGAALLAESGAVAGAVVIVDGAQGASWNGDLRGLQAALRAGGERFDRFEPLDLVDPWPQHVFCGRLAAALADGADRQDALDAALLAWWRHARPGHPWFPGQRIDGEARNLLDGAWRGYDDRSSRRRRHSDAGVDPGRP